MGGKGADGSGSAIEGAGEGWVFFRVLFLFLGCVAGGTIDDARDWVDGVEAPDGGALGVGDGAAVVCWLRLRGGWGPSGG